MIIGSDVVDFKLEQWRKQDSASRRVKNKLLDTHFLKFFRNCSSRGPWTLYRSSEML